MVTTKSWKKQIRDKYGIKYILKKEVHELTRANDVLWATRCSKTKFCKRGLPVDMYDSYITRYFYRFVVDRELPYAIISDRYGLHFSDEKFSYYNVHPSVLSAGDKRLLGKEIRRKAKSRGFTNIVFYNNSPLLSKPYFEMLSYTDLEVFFTTKLI